MQSEKYAETTEHNYLKLTNWKPDKYTNITEYSWVYITIGIVRNTAIQGFDIWEVRERESKCILQIH